MEFPYAHARGGLSPRLILSTMFFPFFTNLFILFFEIFSFKIYSPVSHGSNVIAIIGIFIYYLGGLVMFVAYGRSTGGWGELFGRANVCLILCLVITYPVFYLFWLPLIVWQLIIYVGTPNQLWERIFGGTAMSTELLHREFSSSSCQLYMRYIYIGFPFGLFCAIGFLVVIALTPLWYFIFSPVGLGMAGVALHISLRFPHSTEGDFVERIQLSSRMGIFFHVWLLAFPFAVMSIIHIAVVGVTWHGVTLAVVSLLHFVVDFIPATRGLCRRSEY
jgi:hypothetical protein